jgi:hypothetical protein
MVGAVEQIVGRERRERFSQLAWCGDGCIDSRRRVNSNVRQLLLTKGEGHVAKGNIFLESLVRRFGSRACNDSFVGVAEQD